MADHIRSSSNLGITGSDVASVPGIGRDELEIGARIGQGSFGTVYKGVCRGKTVAIKQHKKHEEIELNEFEKEISILVHLRHPNVILLMGACIDTENLVIVMEYMERGDLRKVMSECNPSLTQLLAMARDVAVGMTWLHQSKPPIIHRDLKPTNLLVDENWNVKICDFGLSVFQKTKKSKDYKTAPGTLPWMAPEVLLGKLFDEKCDIYSFSILLWEMITKNKPYLSYCTIEDTHPFIKAVCHNHERPSIDGIRYSSLVKLLKDCWHEVPSERPDFQEVTERVNQAIVDVNITNDKIAADMWKREWPGMVQADWIQFVSCLYKEMKLNLPLPELCENNLNYKCLQRVLTKLDNTGCRQVVELARFSVFLKWFGPISKLYFLDDLHNLLKNPWFHGDIDSQEAENRLKLFKKPSFLVRFSFTEPEKYPFTISKKCKKDIILHIRVHFQNTGKRYGVRLKLETKNNRNKKVEGDRLEDLVELVTRKYLKLKKACPGSMYSDLFRIVDSEGDPKERYQEASSNSDD